MFKVEKTIDVKLETTKGGRYLIDVQILEKIHKYDHLTIQSNGKFYQVSISDIKGRSILLKGFRPSFIPGVIYRTKFILGYTHVYSLLFGSV